MNAQVSIANKKADTTVFNTFAGTCDICFTNCTECVEGWFITSQKSCKSSCDKEQNYLKKVSGKGYGLCEEKPTFMKIECVSCTKTESKKEGVVLVQSPMKNIVLRANMA